MKETTNNKETEFKSLSWPEHRLWSSFLPANVTWPVSKKTGQISVRADADLSEFIGS